MPDGGVEIDAGMMMMDAYMAMPDASFDAGRDAGGPPEDGGTVVPSNDVVVLADEGTWCWYQDERALFIGNRLVVASQSHEGDVQVNSYDLASGGIGLCTVRAEASFDNVRVTAP